MKRSSIMTVLMILAGCYIPQYGFREVGTYSDDPSSYQNLKEDEGLETRITFKKAEKREETGSWVLQFDMKFDNIGVYAVTLTPGEYVLMDDEGHRIAARSPELSRNIENFNLWPKSSLSMSLFFELPPGSDLSKIGSLRFLWQYKIGSRLYRRVTKFLKHEVEYRYREAYPHWYYYPHPHYYYHWFGSCRHGPFCWHFGW